MSANYSPLYGRRKFKESGKSVFSPTAYSELGIGVADLSGFLALIFISATAILMFLKKLFFPLAPQNRRGLLTKSHIVIASLGGAFLLIHADYFIQAPIFDPGVLLGYVSTAIALVVWFTGFSFVERLRYSLLYHGSLSLASISLMVVHAIDLGFNISLEISLALLAFVVVATFTRAIQHARKVFVAVADKEIR